MKNKNICEGCEKEIDSKDICMDTTMPLPFGIFTANLCSRCGFEVSSNPNLVMKIIKDRANKRGIKLPASREDFNKLLLQDREKGNEN